MPRIAAAFVFWLLIAWLFWLDREKEASTSRATWISFIWIGLAASRSAGQWIYLSAPVDAADVNMEGSPIDRTVYLVLLLAGIAVLIARSQRVKRIFFANSSILLFFAYAAVSLFWSDFPDIAFKRWFKAIGDLVMLCIVLTEDDPPFAVRQLLKRLAFVLIPLSVLLIKYFPEYGRTYGRWFGEVHYTGVTTNKNTLGAICMLFGLALIQRLFVLYRNRGQSGRKRMLLANAIVLGTILWLLSIASSMTSWSCFGMGLTVILALNIRAVAKRRRILHFLIPVMLTASASVLFLGVSPDTLTAMGRDPTLTTRTEMWPMLLSLCKNPIGGVGFGSYWLGSRLEQIWKVWEWKPNEAHNGYLEIYLSLGWIGMILLAIVLASGYRKAFVACRRNLDLGSVLLAYFVVGVAYNFSESAFFQFLHPVWIMTLLAMVAYASRLSPRRLAPLCDVRTEDAQTEAALGVLLDPLEAKA